MAPAATLPVPHLDARLFGARRLSALTDEALFERTGVRIAFTGRAGGVSEGPYAALNLGGRVGDDPAAVARNQELLLEALGAGEAALVVPSQVHGDEIVEVASTEPAAVEAARTRALEGADGLLVDVPQVAALLCFADCVPVVLASPTGRFAVVHAGWRGAVAGIAGKAARLLAARDAAELGIAPSAAAARLNAYLGPHIHAECFETCADVRARFVDRYGADVAPDGRHVDLARALADKLGGGLACSRPLTEGVNWLPTELYVGVSGLMLSPKVYVAAGISGQMQHMVGCNRAGSMFAINKDKNAPVFKQCDYGLVGDVKDVLPALVAAL